MQTSTLARRSMIGGMSLTLVGLLGWKWQHSAAATHPGLIPASDPTDIVEGTAAARLIVYAAPTCPHCAEFHRDILPKLRKDWVDKGKLTIVHRGLALNIIDLDVLEWLSSVPLAYQLMLLNQVFLSQSLWVQPWIDRLNTHPKTRPLAQAMLEPVVKAANISNLVLGSAAPRDAFMAIRTNAIKAGVTGTPAFLTPKGELMSGLPSTITDLLPHR